MSVPRCAMTTCDQPAEIEWVVNGHEGVKQNHKLCGACMAIVWDKITLSYKGSAAHEQSSFREITQHECV